MTSSSISGLGTFERSHLIKTGLRAAVSTTLLASKIRPGPESGVLASA
jgi:hypothetical protein